MNAITKMDVLELESILAGYDIGELLRYWPATGGIDQVNYVIRTVQRNAEPAQRDYLLTVLDQAPWSGPGYALLLDTCARFGLPVAAAIRDREGRPFGSVQGQPVLLTTRLPGRHVYNPTLQQVAAIGRFAARLHVAAARLEPTLPELPLNRPWLRRRADDLRGYLPYGAASLLSGSLERVDSLLQREDVTSLPRGVIHTELHRDSVLFTELGLSGVLDLHHVCSGYLIYDLAVAANDWCTDAGGVMLRDRVVALLRAYHAIRPLQLQELWFFSAFALYGGLATWLTRLSVSRQGGRQGARCHNPAELERIVRHHAAKGFYFDPRLLDL